jgi:hypothetical protein
MTGRILLPGEVGAQVEPSLTFEGLRNLLGDMRRLGQRMPSVVLLSEYDRRQVNQEILGASVDEVEKDDQRPEHDYHAVGFIEGVMFRSHPDVPRGKARFLYPAVADTKPLPSGKIISLGARS